LIKRVVYTAAHHGFGVHDVPLGGGAAVSEALAQEWAHTKPFDLEMVNPSILRDAAPQNKDLVRYSEWRYARFCRDFERAQTAKILSEDPKSTAVLVNDVSEGPDFAALASANFEVWTIYHVDVIDYFTRMYLRKTVTPERAVHIYDRTARLFPKFMPSILDLIFKKQIDSVRYSKGVIVPSAGMKTVIERCFPWADSGKIHVIPWGVWDRPIDEDEVSRAITKVSGELQLRPGTWTLLTLSRISPEKRQDRLLEALQRWEQRPDYPANGITVIIAGEAAYMNGFRFEMRLRKLASKLERTTVHFVGYAAGARKAALFSLADLYVFPSEHESYGLTLLEAMRAGLPVLCAESHGVRDIMRSGFARIVTAENEARMAQGMMENLRELLKDRTRLREMGKAAKDFASRQKFSDAAAHLATLLTSA
jgi:glycosyltransferase involved in cell wall biosynthesis